MSSPPITDPSGGVLILNTHAEGNGLVSPFAPIRWCLTPDAAKQLAHRDVEHPWVLMVTEQNGQETGRYAYPCSDVMRRVQFHRSGQHRLHAAVVWTKEKSKPKRLLLQRRRDGRYEMDLLRPRRIRLEDELMPRLAQLNGQKSQIDHRISTQRSDYRNRHTSAASLRSQLKDLEESLANAGSVVADAEAASGLAAMLSELRAQIPARESEVNLDEGVDTELFDQRAVLTAEIEQMNAAIEEAHQLPPDEFVLHDDLSAGGVRVSRLSGEAQMDINVRPQFFAQPWRITKWLASRYQFWQRPALDGCSVRRRAIVTGATLPGYAVATVGLWMMSTISVAFFLAAGMRGINYEPLRHPWRTKPWEVGSDLQPSIWQQRRHEGSYRAFFTPRHPLLRLINPPTVLGALIMGYLVDRYVFDLFDRIYILVLGIGLSAVLAVAIYFLGLLIGKVIATQIGEEPTESGQTSWEIEELATRIARERLEARLQQFACQAGTPEATLASVPAGQRTLTMYFEDAKAKVCKPLEGTD